jgi:hypothetical protein
MNNLFVGVIEDINDPHKRNRCKVRVFGLHTDDKSKVSTEDLPWSLILNSPNGSVISGIGNSTTFYKKGMWVIVTFLDEGPGEYQTPLILGSIIGKFQEKPNPENGFSDDEGKYPNDEYLNGSCINKLSKNEDNGSVASKLNDSDLSINTNFNPEYPSNKVVETKSGHIIEIDDTDGYERINVYHKSGSFVEIYSDGSRVDRTVGNKNDVVKGNMIVKIKGDVNIDVEGDVIENVSGNKTVNVTGTLAMNGAEIRLNG